MSRWVDAGVVATWQRFVEAINRKDDVPADVMGMVVRIDHAILTELAQVAAQQMDPVERAMLPEVVRRRRALRGL